MKAQLDVKKLPQEEYKHLADLLNKAEDRQEPCAEVLKRKKPVPQAMVKHKEQERPDYAEAAQWTAENNRNQV